MSSISAANPLVSQAVSQALNPATSGTSSASQPAATPNNQLTGSSFLQLLIAQLKAQDPLNPADPTTFVTQLVQFNQLQQLIDINQTLSQTASGGTGTSQTNNPQPAAPQGNGTAAANSQA